jgi:hypothetical protein
MMEVIIISPQYQKGTSNSSSSSSVTTNNVNFTNYRQKLIDKVSSEKELITISDKFRNLVKTLLIFILLIQLLIQTQAHLNIYYLINPQLINSTNNKRKLFHSDV